VLAVSRPEWLTALSSDRQLISQPPAPGSARALQAFDDLAVFGDADAIAAPITELLGIRPTGERLDADFWVCSGGPDVPRFDRPYLPEHGAVSIDDATTVHYASEHTPIVTSRGGRMWWQPTDWSEPFNQFLPKYQLGSTYPAYLVASLLSARAGEAGRSHVAGIARANPVAFHAWRSRGIVHLLLGNLETGELGDSRVARNVCIRLSAGELGLADGDVALRRIDGNGPERLVGKATGAGFVEVRLELEPEASAVYVVDASHGERD
jgi:hypothetical protein